MPLQLPPSKQGVQYDRIVQQEKDTQEQITTLDEVTMLWYLEDHRRMEDLSTPLDAFNLCQLNSNNQSLRLIDVEQLIQRKCFDDALCKQMESQQ
jgi:hypothetical protein